MTIQRMVALDSRARERGVQIDWNSAFLGSRAILDELFRAEKLCSWTHGIRRFRGTANKRP